MSRSRAYHALTAAVALVALVLQLVLVVKGSAILVEENPPSMGDRLLRFLAYFTVQSNLLVLVTTAQLARRPARDGTAWRVVRTMAISGITVTGLVHWFLLPQAARSCTEPTTSPIGCCTSPSRSSRWRDGWSSAPDRGSTGASASGRRCGPSPGWWWSCSRRR